MKKTFHLILSLITVSILLSAGCKKENTNDGPLRDSRDGNPYLTVIIGEQRWMAGNLNYNSIGSYYNNYSPDGYGRLYTWDAAMVACPEGWHLPTDAEWQILEHYLGMNSADTSTLLWRGSDQGIQLKSTSGWYDDGEGNNSSGFNAFPAGFYTAGAFYTLGTDATFWTSTESSSTKAYARNLKGNNTGVYREDYYLKSYGYSCRCVED